MENSIVAPIFLLLEVSPILTYTSPIVTRNTSTRCPCSACWLGFKIQAKMSKFDQIGDSQDPPPRLNRVKESGTTHLILEIFSRNYIETQFPTFLQRLLVSYFICSASINSFNSYHEYYSAGPVLENLRTTLYPIFSSFSLSIALSSLSSQAMHRLSNTFSVDLN